MPNLIRLFIDWFVQNKLESAATVIGIIGVWLMTKQNIWCWIISFIGIILSLYVFFVSKLYLATGLQVFYLFMTLYGWYSWLYGGKDKQELEISRIKMPAFIFFIITGIISVFVLGYIFQNYTDAALPYLDSVTTVCGIFGTYMMAKKIMEHWLLWIFNDLLCVGIYFSKNLYGFTLLYFVYICLAIYGFIEWRKDYKRIVN